MQDRVDLPPRRRINLVCNLSNFLPDSNMAEILLEQPGGPYHEYFDSVVG